MSSHVTKTWTTHDNEVELQVVDQKDEIVVRFPLTAIPIEERPQWIQRAKKVAEAEGPFCRVLIYSTHTTKHHREREV